MGCTRGGAPHFLKAMLLSFSIADFLAFVNCFNFVFGVGVMFGVIWGNHLADGSADTLRCLPVCCSPVVTFSELVMSLS